MQQNCKVKLRRLPILITFFLSTILVQRVSHHRSCNSFRVVPPQAEQLDWSEEIVIPGRLKGQISDRKYNNIVQFLQTDFQDAFISTSYTTLMAANQYEKQGGCCGYGGPCHTFIIGFIAWPKMRKWNDENMFFNWARPSAAAAARRELASALQSLMPQPQCRPTPGHGQRRKGFTARKVKLKLTRRPAGKTRDAGHGASESVTRSPWQARATARSDALDLPVPRPSRSPRQECRRQASGGCQCQARAPGRAWAQCRSAESSSSWVEVEVRAPSCFWLRALRVLGSSWVPTRTNWNFKLTPGHHDQAHWPGRLLPTPMTEPLTGSHGMYWCYKTVQCNNISKSLPIENLGQNHDFRTRETLRKSIFETLRKLAKLSGLAKLKIAKPCKLEILWNNAKPSYLRKFVKACESLRNLICENLRNLIVFAKAYLQSLWISYMHFARANACENTICINPIVKHYLRKPNCEMHHSYLLLAPPPPLSPSQAGQHQPRLLSLIILNFFRRFIIAITKPIASTETTSPLPVPNASLYTNLWQNTKSVTQLFQVHRIVVIYLT